MTKHEKINQVLTVRDNDSEIDETLRNMQKIADESSGADVGAGLGGTTHRIRTLGYDPIAYFIFHIAYEQIRAADKDDQWKPKVFDVKKRKIIRYSNVIATAGNAMIRG